MLGKRAVERWLFFFKFTRNLRYISMKLKVNVPDSLSDITLDQYQRFDAINTDENADTTFLMQKMVEIFCDVDLMLTNHIRYRDLLDITGHINILLNQKPELVTVFKMDSIEYGFIPKLDDITLGEYVDLDNYLAGWDKMHQAMSVLYRPVYYRKGERYLIEEYKGSDNADQMKRMPLEAAISAILFFWNLKTELLDHSLNYLKTELREKLTSEQLQILEQNGDGINQSLHSLQEILNDLKISQNWVH